MNAGAGTVNGYVDVYGFTQRVITGTPTQTTTFTYRNGGTSQNIINATYEAIGY